MEDKYIESSDTDDMIDEPCRSCEHSQVAASCFPCNECLHLLNMFGGQTFL